MRGLSLVAETGGHSSSRCAGLSLSRPLLLRSTGSRRAGSAVVMHGPSCSAACGIFPDQGSNPRPLHWQADSQPQRHQESPSVFLVNTRCTLCSSESYPRIITHMLGRRDKTPGNTRGTLMGMSSKGGGRLSFAFTLRIISRWPSGLNKRAASGITREGAAHGI